MKKSITLWRISVATSLEAEDAVAEMLEGVLGENASCYFDLERQASLVSVYRQHPQSPATGQRRKIRDGLVRIQNC